MCPLVASTATLPVRVALATGFTAGSMPTIVVSRKREEHGANRGRRQKPCCRRQRRSKRQFWWTRKRVMRSLRARISRGGADHKGKTFGRRSQKRLWWESSQCHGAQDGQAADARVKETNHSSAISGRECFKRGSRGVIRNITGKIASGTIHVRCRRTLRTTCQSVRRLPTIRGVRCLPMRKRSSLDSTASITPSGERPNHAQAGRNIL